MFLHARAIFETEFGISLDKKTKVDDIEKRRDSRTSSTGASSNSRKLPSNSRKQASQGSRKKPAGWMQIIPHKHLPDGTKDVLLSRAACVHVCKSILGDDALSVYVVNKTWTRWETQRQSEEDSKHNTMMMKDAAANTSNTDPTSPMKPKKKTMNSLSQLTAKIPINSFLDELTKEFRDTPKGNLLPAFLV